MGHSKVWCNKIEMIDHFHFGRMLVSIGNHIKVASRSQKFARSRSAFETTGQGNRLAHLLLPVTQTASAVFPQVHDN
jgi:hypothetical protein